MVEDGAGIGVNGMRTCFEQLNLRSGKVGRNEQQDAIGEQLVENF